MAVGLVICAIVLAICSVIVLLVLRNDLKQSEALEAKGKRNVRKQK